VLIQVVRAGFQVPCNSVTKATRGVLSSNTFQGYAKTYNSQSLVIL
jgi:hypothetical protein